MNNLIGERITEQKRLIDNKSQDIYSILSEIKTIDKNFISAKIDFAFNYEFELIIN